MNFYYQQFLIGLQNAAWYEIVAAVAGIASVWFSRKESIWVYPVGLINTTIYIFISYKYHLLGEATVNFYYTVMSIYGWWLWARKDEQTHTYLLNITKSNRKEWVQQLLFFAAIFIIYYLVLHYAKQYFFEGVIPFADAFATATAFTGMWLMAKKKVESWYWWLATNITSIPLYFVKNLMFTSVQYMVLLVLAIFGLLEWKRKTASAT